MLTRPFCLYEISTALDLEKKLMLMHETDGRHGAFDFGADEVKHAPPGIGSLLLNNESLPWRRRRFEQDAILAELIKASGLVRRQGLSASEAGPAPAASAGMGTAGGAVAAIPGTVPNLPDAFTPRPDVQLRVLDLVLDRTADERCLLYTSPSPRDRG